MQWDVIVIGAGAAGLMAAARAAEQGRKTLLLEKNPRPGTKILMSGGTRCNITQNTDSRGIVAAYGKQGRFLHSALAALSPADLIALFEAEGVATKIEETGKVFPVSNQARDVLDALTIRLDRSGCEMALREPLLEINLQEDGFQLKTPRRTLSAAKVIITTGGKSYPGSGTTGDAYPWLAALGHTIVPPRPALTPVTTNSQRVAALSGVTIPDVLVRVYVDPGEGLLPQGKPAHLAEARGSFLFAHFGMSGPSVLDVSRVIPGHPDPLLLVCDFLPNIKFEDLYEQLREQCLFDGKKRLLSLMPRLVPRRLSETLLDQLDLSHIPAAELSKQACRRLTEAIKQYRIPISGTRGFKKAEVTTGGVALEEVDSSTMQSKIVPNLYLAGEVLDLDGPIGGYNFQAAFSTAWLAGGSV